MQINDLEMICNTACHIAFNRLADNGHDPVLKCNDDRFTILTENGSGEFCTVFGHRNGLIGKAVLTIEVIPGEGKESNMICEVMADAFISIATLMSDDDAQ